MGKQHLRQSAFIRGWFFLAWFAGGYSKVFRLP
jgi:hypothetical protein